MHKYRHLEQAFREDSIKKCQLQYIGGNRMVSVLFDTGIISSWYVPRGMRANVFDLLGMLDESIGDGTYLESLTVGDDDPSVRDDLEPEGVLEEWLAAKTLREVWVGFAHGKFGAALYESGISPEQDTTSLLEKAGDTIMEALQAATAALSTE